MLIFSALTGCGPEAVSFDPECLVPPAGFEQMDADVRAQYRTLREDAARRLDDPGAPAAGRAEAAGKIGMWHLAYRFPGEAVVCLRHATALAPHDPRWPYYLGHAARKSGDLESARSAFGRMLELRPDYVPALVHLARIEVLAGRAGDGARLLDEARRRRPGSAAVLTELGELALKEGRHGQAVEFLQAALDGAPQATAIRYKLALAYRALGERERAAALMTGLEEGVGEGSASGLAHARLHDPLWRRLESLQLGGRRYSDLGKEARRQGDMDGAVAAFRRAAESKPHSEPERLRLADALYQAGRAAEALAVYADLLSRNPGHAKARLQLARILSRSGRLADAISHLRRAIETDPRFWEAESLLARLLQGTGHHGEALEHYARTLELNPAQERTPIRYALLLTQMDRREEALEVLQAARARPTVDEAVDVLALRLRAASPNPDAALAAALREAHALFGRRPVLTHAETLSMLYAAAGDYDRATAWASAALETAQAAGRRDLSAAVERGLARLEDGENWPGIPPTELVPVVPLTVAAPDGEP